MANTEELSAATKHKYIDAAIRAKNPLETIPHQIYRSANGEEFKLYCRSKNDMDALTLKWAFKLEEENVGPFYAKLPIGWQPKVKQAELRKNWARFLVAHNKENRPVAFAMFRFDMDDGDCVLYCYEMHVSPKYQRKGLGKFMMETLEACARHWHLQKVILTALINNDISMLFFKSIGYEKDETSPDILENAHYEILSKSMI